MAVPRVPPSVLKKRKRLTAKDLFSGDIVFISMVIAGANQFSAQRYSRANMDIEKAKPDGVVI